MKTRNDFTIEGLDELISACTALPAEQQAKMQPIIDQTGDILHEESKKKVSQKFSKAGTLRNSLFLKRQTKNGVITNVLTWGDDVRKYAAPLELGHGLVFMGRRTNKYVQPHPFLRPAADENKEKIFGMIIDGMNKTLDEMGGIK